MQINQSKFKYEISLSQFHFKPQHLHKSINSTILHLPLMGDFTLDRYSLGRSALEHQNLRKGQGNMNNRISDV